MVSLIDIVRFDILSLLSEPELINVQLYGSNSLTNDKNVELFQCVYKSGDLSERSQRPAHKSGTSPVGNQTPVPLVPGDHANIWAKGELPLQHS